MALPVGRRHHQIGQFLQPGDGSINAAETDSGLSGDPLPEHLAPARPAVGAGEEDSLCRSGFGVREAAVCAQLHAELGAEIPINSHGLSRPAGTHIPVPCRGTPRRLRPPVRAPSLRDRLFPVPVLAQPATDHHHRPAAASASLSRHPTKPTNPFPDPNPPARGHTENRWGAVRALDLVAGYRINASPPHLCRGTP